MAYDEELADRIRERIGNDADVSEQRMFGGLAFLVGGHLAVAAGQDDVLVRVDPAESDKLIASGTASLMEMRGKALRGWMRVEADAVRTKRQLQKWVDRGVGFARSLPAKPKR